MEASEGGSSVDTAGEPPLTPTASAWAKFTTLSSFPINDVGPLSHEVVSDLYWLLPGLSTHVKCPATKDAKRGRPCPFEHVDSIGTLVVHLNDLCGWSRGDVADWLDTLDADLTFPSEPTPRPKRTHRRRSAGHTYMYFDYSPLEVKLHAKLIAATVSAAMGWGKSSGYSLGFDGSFWIDEATTTPAPAWQHGPFPEKPTTPELPTWDELRKDSLDAPNHFARVEYKPEQSDAALPKYDPTSYTRLKEKRGRHRRT